MLETVPKYSLLKALGKEIRENPLRCGLAMLNTAGILIYVAGYLIDKEYPARTYVEASLLLRPTAGGIDLNVAFKPVGPGDVTDVYGEMLLTFESGTQTRIVNLTPALPGSALPEIHMPVRVAPKQLAFCIHTRNLQGARSQETILFASDGPNGELRPAYLAEAGGCPE